MTSSSFPFNKFRFLSKEGIKSFFSKESNYRIYYFSEDIIEKYYEYINWELYILSYSNLLSDNSEEFHKLVRKLYVKHHKYLPNCNFCEYIQKREIYNKNKYNYSDFCQIYAHYIRGIKFDFENLDYILSKLVYPPFTLKGVYYREDTNLQRNQLLYIGLINNIYIDKTKLFEYLLPEYHLMDHDVKSFFVQILPLTKDFLLNNLDIMKNKFLLKNKNFPKETLELIEKINLLK